MTDHGASRAPGALVDAVAAVALLLAAPVLTWWAVGDLSEAGTDLTYGLTPPDLAPGTETALGLGALVTAVAAAGLLARTGSALRRDPRWLGVLAPLLAVSAAAGGAYRVVTAGVIGANIGAGLIILLGGPLAAVLVAGAAARAGWLLTRGRRGRAGPQAGAHR